MKKLLKRIAPLLLALVMVMGSCLTVSAAGNSLDECLSSDFTPYKEYLKNNSDENFPFVGVLLSCSYEAIQKEYLIAQTQINHDMPIEINEKKVIRSYLAILSFVWIFPYIVGILSCSPHLGVMVYMPAMVLFFTVAGILEKYLDVFPFKKSTYRLINFGVHAMFIVASFVYFFIRLS